MEKLKEAPDKIWIEEYVGSNGIHCLDYQNFDGDVEYTRSDILVIPRHETVEQWEERTGEIYPNLGYTITWSNHNKAYKLYFYLVVITTVAKNKIYVVDLPEMYIHHGKPEKESEDGE